MALAAPTGTLKRTPFHEIHCALGGKMVPFAGYEMPVQYPTGITAEHHAVRNSCGLFDVSHMGEFIVRGDDAVAFVNAVTTNDVGALAVGQVHYSTILNEQGTIEDDCLVYRFPEHLMLVVNASNRDKDLAHLEARTVGYKVTIDDISDAIALLALQGPKAAEILQPLTDTNLSTVKYYHFVQGSVVGLPNIIISRTGYTGEDGFELYFDPKHATQIWNSLTGGGEVTPCGLGARDSLRLEMGMALYGNDIDGTTTPLEANLGWLVKLKKGGFVGKEALVRQKEQGVARKLVGFTVSERAFPRHGYPVFFQGEQVDIVRSGTMSPTLGTGIGTCYVPLAAAAEGTPLEIDIRGKRVPAIVVKMPFHKGGSHL